MATFNIYVRENISDPKTTLATGLTSQSYSVSGLTKGKKYLFSVGAEKNGVEKVSVEKVMLFGKEWTPSNLSNLAKLWFNADNVVADSSNRISQVTNTASNNYHFSQSTSANKAIKQFDSAINHNVMQFDGVDDYYINQSANALSANVNKLWSFAVHKRATIESKTNTVFGFSTGGGTTTGRFRHYATTTANVNNVGTGTRRLDSDTFVTLYDTQNSGSGWVISLAYRDYLTAKSLVSVNGNEYTAVSGTTGNTQNTVANNAWIGAEGPSAGFMNGSISELLVGNTALTQADIDRLFGWAAHKYGLTDNLPEGHPYKILVPTV